MPSGSCHAGESEHRRRIRIAVGVDRRARQRRHRVHPAAHHRRPPGARRVPRTAVGRQHLPPVLLTETRAEREGTRCTSPTSTWSTGLRSPSSRTTSSSPGRATNGGRAETRPKRRSWSTTPTRAPASPRCCSNTSPPSHVRTASSGSPPRSSATTGRCSPCSPRPGGHCSGASTRASSTSTGSSPTPTSSSTASSDANNAPTPVLSPESCFPGPSPSSGPPNDPGSVGDAIWRHVADSVDVPMHAVNPDHDDGARPPLLSDDR